MSAFIDCRDLAMLNDVPCSHHDALDDAEHIAALLVDVICELDDQLGGAQNRYHQEWQRAEQYRFAVMRRDLEAFREIAAQLRRMAATTSGSARQAYMVAASLVADRAER